MTFAWAGRAVLGGMLITSGCKGGSSAPGATFDAGADAASPALSFAFDPSVACAAGGVCAPPSQVLTLEIDATLDTTVNVALEGAYADAALSTDHVTTTGQRAYITLETSTTPTTFTIVARSGLEALSPRATLTVAVGASGFAIVQATPVYTGTRTMAPDFLATSVRLTTCADLAANPPIDLTWLPGVAGAPPFLFPVEADEHVAVEVRISHYAMGCVDIPPLAASVTSALNVDVNDIPIALGLTDMRATFAFASEEGWSTAMSTTAASVSGAFFASSSDGKALLDAIQTQVPAGTALSQFEASRAQGGWDATADDWLASRTPSIHDRASTLLATAVAAGVGPLAVHLAPGPTLGTATGTPEALNAISATLAGIAVPPPFTWTAAADDTVHLAGTLTFSSSLYIAHLADSLAPVTAAGGAPSVPSSIASQIDCSDLATKLVGAGNAYAACDAGCLGALCASALTSVWTNALAPPSSGSDNLTVSFNVSATTTVGDNAEPLYFQGGWLGEVSGALASPSFTAEGTVVGVEPVTSP